MKALKFEDGALALAIVDVDEAKAALGRVLDLATTDNKVIAYDVETQGLSLTDDAVRLVQFGTDMLAVNLLVEANADLVEVAKWFIAECIERGLTMTAHNAGFDALRLERLGVCNAVDLIKATDDTLTLAALVEQPRKIGSRAGGYADKDLLVQMAEKRAGEPLPRKMLALKTLTDDWLPYSIATKAQADLEAFYQYNGMTKATVWREIDLWNVAYQRYAACDVLDTARLHPLLKASVSVIVGQDVLDRERALDAFSVRSERRGFLLDMKRIDAEIAASAGKDSEIDKLKAELKDKYGLVNPNAAKQIADAIERETGTRPTTTDADGNVKDSTSADTLKLMTGSACAATVLKYKKLNKVESTYGVVWKDKYADANGYAHPSLNPRGSSTGRMTMTSPSLLNVPQEAREYVIAEPGYVFVQSDFSAVEVRIGGAEAGDKQMYADLAGGADPYSIVAKEAFGEAFTKADRNACKPILLGRMYGRSANSLAKQQQVANPDIDLEAFAAEATRIMRSIDRRWPDLKQAAYREAAITKAGRTRITLASGRCISLDLVGARDTFNALVQGTGRELLVDAMLRLIETGYEEYLWLPIHDEWILQVPEADADKAVQDMAEAMTTTYKGVPIITEPQILGTVWKKG